jgi:hypothetical protein
MSMPPVNANTTFESFLQELPANYHDLALEFKAFTRARKIKTPAQLMQVVMCYCGIDHVLRDTAGDFTLLEERLSDTAIHNRLKACVPWVKALLTEMMGAAVQPLLEGNLRIVVVDGSTVQSPGATGTEYRLHLAIDLVRLHLVHAVVTDEHTAESLTHYPLQDGDIAMMDRGYNQVEMWIETADRGAGLIARYNPHGLHLYDAEGQAIDVAQPIRDAAAAGTDLCVPVQVRDPKKKADLEGHLHGRRLPPAQAAEARRRARASAQKAGRQLKPRTLPFAEWVFIWTTLPLAVLSTDTIMALYRVRWQVELVIKRLKSILNIDHLRARKNSLLADLYLHGKLLYAWVVEKRSRRRCGDDWNRLDQPRRATAWRVWRKVQEELRTAISGVREWDERRWPDAEKVLQERPRRRPLQTVPKPIGSLIAYCQARGLSNI